MMRNDDEETYYELILSFILNLFGITDDMGEKEEESIIQRFLVRFFFLLSGAPSDAFKEVESTEQERYKRMDFVTKSVFSRRIDENDEILQHYTLLPKENIPRCSICLESYNEGNEVTWSPNENCTHVFHKACIIEWLIEQEKCPCCRHFFMKPIVAK